MAASAEGGQGGGDAPALHWQRRRFIAACQLRVWKAQAPDRLWSSGVRRAALLPQPFPYTDLGDITQALAKPTDRQRIDHFGHWLSFPGRGFYGGTGNPCAPGGGIAGNRQGTRARGGSATATIFLAPRRP
jgi:hypothetical protein